MLPYFSIEYFKIGPLTIYTWGFFIALAFLIGLILSLRAGKKIGIAANKIITLIIFVYLGAMIGSRLFFILQWPADFFVDPLMFFSINGGGMMFYGGLVGGALAGWMYIRKWENRWQLVGALSPVIPLALAIGRIGCFLLNDHEGALTGVAWAIRWPDGTLRHPVALYLILFDLALAGFLWWFSHRHSEEYNDEEFPMNVGNSVSHSREILQPLRGFGMTNNFLLFLTLYPFGRFFLDFTRDPSADPHFLGLASSQWISLFILTFILLYYIIKRSKSESSFQ